MPITANNPATTLVRDVMTTRVFTLEPDDSIYSAVCLFEAERFHHLVIVERGKIQGVISDRDILKAISPFLGQSSLERPQDLATGRRRIHQIMTRKPVTIHADQTLTEAARTMLDRRVSCLPVVNDQGALVGILSTKDLIAQLAEAAPAADAASPSSCGQ
jgi:acetoin utilization protein AcuB